MNITCGKKNLPAQDSFLAWFYCFLASSFFACELMRVTMFGSLVPALMKEYSVGAARIGMLSATFSFAAFIFVYPAGLLLDKIPLKKIFVSAIAISTCATFLIYFSHSLNKLQLYLFFAGIGNAFGLIGSIKFINSWLAPRKIALATGLLISYGMIGGMFAQTPMTFLIAKFSWRAPWLLLAILELSVLIAIVLLVPQREHVFSQDVVEDTNKNTNTMTAITNFLHIIKASLGNKQNWLAGTYTSILNLPIVVLGALWGIAYLTRVYVFSQSTAANIVAMIFVGMILGSPFVGWFTNKIKSRKLPMLYGAILSIIIAGVLIINRQLTPLWCYLLFFGLGFCSSVQVLGYTVAGESNDAGHRAASLGLVSMIVLAGWVLFQPLFAWFMQLGWRGEMVGGVPIYSIANYRYALFILPLTFVIGMIQAIFIKETYPHN